MKRSPLLGRRFRGGPTARAGMALFLIGMFVWASALAQSPAVRAASDNRPDKCTVITVGKKASADGSVMTSHTCDSHRTRSEFNIVAAKKHKSGSMAPTFKRVDCDTFAMPS